MLVKNVTHFDDVLSYQRNSQSLLLWRLLCLCHRKSIDDVKLAVNFADVTRASIFLEIFLFFIQIVEIGQVRVHVAEIATTCSCFCEVAQNVWSLLVFLFMGRFWRFKFCLKAWKTGNWSKAQKLLLRKLCLSQNGFNWNECNYDELTRLPYRREQLERSDIFIGG